MKKIVLASTSIYRREQLNTLGIPFECLKPLFDEDVVKHGIVSDLKDPVKIAQSLSFQKGASIAAPDKITISGDQLVSFEGLILGKPGNRDKSIEQLLKLQSKTHELITACTVFNGLMPLEILNITSVTVKPLTVAQIKNYVDLDHPWDCAGSYKIEKHGIQILDSIKTDDFTAIQGLPLLALAKALGSLSISIPFTDGNV
jgi:septum formation protein